MGATWSTFTALGTYTFVAVRDRARLEHVERVAQLVLRDVDQVCSRFRADSDLSVVNAHPGRWVAVDPLLVAGVAVAVDAAAETDGLVHPLLGRHLVQLGYDRDFDALVDLGGSPFGTPPPDARAWEHIELDPGGAIKIPHDTALDLGATGKAWAADLVATAVERDLDTPAIVSVGGDVRIAGAGSWPVAVSERPGADPDVVVRLDGGGLATSSTQVRRWSRSGTRLHHLLDPRTGRPAREVWRTVTTTGPTCTAANAASTAAVVLGTDAPAWLAARKVTARLVGSDGQVLTTAGWPSDEDAA